ncbi:BTAD domain-containing putative transcriptional regulator [Streptomyces uncialis]|uniref:BTAD domain-containing putative transcriptional regulator n=1 Tax=Streptomyces uncialis TaxID=1048205 RepID=UPI00366009EE
MYFEVLGPLGVRTADGQPVRVPELKVRALLANLLVRRDRPVSADRLIEDLWGAGRPGNPAAALQNKVWQLRRTLEDAEPGGRDLVVSRPPGYQLRTAPDTVDADRFDRLTAQARAAGDPRVRAGLLADALALWRGPAFADLADEEFTRAARQRLDEQRLTALEEQAETRLELGEHGLVADGLGDLVAEHPLRERLRTVQLRALYLAGRQSAALSGYAELRARLADGLGVEPGPELAALHQAILTQDPSLTAAVSPAAVSPATLSPATLSPAAVSARPPTNVSAELTGLVGRADALRELGSLLAVNRLVTLTGAGGVGKTRLALATAAQLADGFPGGVRLAEFAALEPSRSGGERVIAAATGVYDVVAAALGMRDDAPTGHGRTAAPLSTVDRLVRALGRAPALLVFDNCEHVVHEVAELAEQLLVAAPGLRILATAQRPLGVAGEHLLEVPPLQLPGAAADLDPDAVRRFGAVELFVARAGASAPRFVLDATTVDAVVAVCRRLDGIPLALEMAATRVRALGVRELAARLDDRFRLLAAGARGAPARQRTLRAVIDWSWELLDEPERAVLRRLAAHADGCALTAAEELCAGDGIAPSDVLDLLARLVDCSLVVMTDTADGPRYRLLESVAAYGAERLGESGEAEETRARHRAYYTELAEHAAPLLRGHDQRRWLRRLDAEQANLRGALESAVHAGDAVRALRLVNALAWYWHLRGRNHEARRSLTLALSVDPAAPAGLVAAAGALLGGIRLQLGGGDPAGEYRAALEPYDALDDPGGRARMEWFLASKLYGVADPVAAEELVDRALETFRSLDDRWGTAAALGSRTFHAKTRGDFAALRRDGERSLELFRELGDQWGQLQAMVPLAKLAEAVGDYGHAERLYQDGLRMAEELKLWPEFVFQLSGVGRLALLAGRLARARECHERARRLAVEQSDVFGEQYAEIGLGLGARRSGELDTAQAHMERVIELHRQMGYEPGAPPLILAELGFTAELRGDAPTALRLQREGLAAARATGDPRAVALALEGLAGALSLAGRWSRAARLLGAADAARRAVGIPLPQGERGDVDRIGARLATVLDERVHAAEFTAGTRLDPDSAVREAEAEAETNLQA